MFLLTVDCYVSMHIFIFLTVSSTKIQRIHFEQNGINFSQIFTVEKNTRIFKISSYITLVCIWLLYMLQPCIILNSSNIVEHLSTISTFASFDSPYRTGYYPFFIPTAIYPRPSLLLTSINRFATIMIQMHARDITSASSVTLQSMHSDDWVNSRFAAAYEHASPRSKSRRSAAKSALRGWHRLRNETQQMDSKFNRDLASRVRRHRQVSTECRDRTK